MKPFELRTGFDSDYEYSLECAEIKGIQASIYRRKKDKTGWYIEADIKSDERKLERIGPFDTPELAWSTLQLLKD